MVSILEGALARTLGSALRSLFLDATLTRDVAGTIVDPADPPAPTQVTFPCKALEEEYSATMRSAGLVGASDVKIMILATSLAVEPVPGDRIAITRAGVVGPQRTIVPGEGGQKGVTSDPARATWECRAST